MTTDRAQIRKWAEHHDAVPVRPGEPDAGDLQSLSNLDLERGERLSSLST